MLVFQFPLLEIGYLAFVAIGAGIRFQVLLAEWNLEGNGVLDRVAPTYLCVQHACLKKCLVLVAALGVGLVSRTPLALDVIRDRNALYRETHEGLVENVYTLKLINMDGKDHRYEIAVSGIDGMELRLDADLVPVAAHEVLSISARVRADPYSLTRASSTIVFTLQAIDDGRLRVEEEARFLGPVSPER